MNIITVIPARGGSKGIPKKNIYPVLGKPLLCYTIEAALESKVCGDIVVSTDSSEIKEVANRYEDICVINRPDELANDTATTESALMHAIDYMKSHFDRQYDAVMTLQPVSPLRKGSTIADFVYRFKNRSNDVDAMLTLHEDRSDFWIKKEDGTYGRLDPKAPRRRQERKPLYIENSAIYITMISSLYETGSVLGKNAEGFVVSTMEGVDVNDYIDLYLVEALLKRTN